jgi:hypothetical protein
MLDGKQSENILDGKQDNTRQEKMNNSSMRGVRGSKSFDDANVRRTSVCLEIKIQREQDCKIY